MGTDEYTTRVEALHAMIEPYVIGTDGEQDYATHLRDESSFTSSLQTILTFLQGRVEAALNLSIDDNWEYSAQTNTRGAGGPPVQ